MASGFILLEDIQRAASVVEDFNTPVGHLKRGDVCRRNTYNDMGRINSKYVVIEAIVKWKSHSGYHTMANGSPNWNPDQYDVVYQELKGSVSLNNFAETGIYRARLVSGCRPPMFQRCERLHLKRNAQDNMQTQILHRLGLECDGEPQVTSAEKVVYPITNDEYGVAYQLVKATKGIRDFRERVNSTVGFITSQSEILKEFPEKTLAYAFELQSEVDRAKVSGLAEVETVAQFLADRRGRAAGLSQ